MARRVDQWVKQAHGFTAHEWEAGALENDYYNGARNLLSRCRNVTGVTLDRITVMACDLALGTPQPDVAFQAMLEYLGSHRTAGGTAQAVALSLKELLSKPRMLHASHYNEVMNITQKGVSRIMASSERYALFKQLQIIYRAGNSLLRTPDRFAVERASWRDVRTWISENTLPPIKATDGSVTSVDGLEVTSHITEFLREAARVIFPVGTI
jgi:hypothetical protein